MNKKLILILSLLLILFIGCTKTNEPPKLEPEPEKMNPPIVEEPSVDPIKEMLNEMTLEEKIGQLLIIGLEGLDVTENEITQIVAIYFFQEI